MHTKPWVRARARRDYWENMKPAGGRPYCPSMSCPDNWGVTKVKYNSIHVSKFIDVMSVFLEHTNC